MKKIYRFAEAAAVIVVLQALRILLEAVIEPLVPDTEFSRRMTTMAVMLVLAAAVALYSRITKTKLSVFPESFSKIYVVFTVISALLLITTPAHFTQGITAIMLSVYGSIVTPVFEELVFRGYLWNRLNDVLAKKAYTYIASVALFGIWHLGYMLPQLAAGELEPVIWKLAAGIGYGAVLGALRMKTNNCYSTMLLHGVINIFMI